MEVSLFRAFNEIFKEYNCVYKVDEHYTKQKNGVDDWGIKGPSEFIISILLTIKFLFRESQSRKMFLESLAFFGPHAISIHELKSCFHGNQLNCWLALNFSQKLRRLGDIGQKEPKHNVDCSI